MAENNDPVCAPETNRIEPSTFGVPSCPWCGDGPIVPGRAGKLTCTACGAPDIVTCCEGAPCAEPDRST